QRFFQCRRAGITVTFPRSSFRLFKLSSTRLDRVADEIVTPSIYPVQYRSCMSYPTAITRSWASYNTNRSRTISFFNSHPNAKRIKFNFQSTEVSPANIDFAKWLSKDVH